MAYLDDLKTTRDQMASILVEITTSPKPSYSIDGQAVSWTEYLKMLQDQLSKMNELIQDAEPYELHSVGYN